MIDLADLLENRVDVIFRVFLNVFLGLPKINHIDALEAIKEYYKVIVPYQNSFSRRLRRV